ncbi:MAG TPA: hypothetical protein VG275_07165 [Solirubrobacteraceae bacterium]|nr:hypothetical protein [Solirubrobacteraceae bacterium]
MRERGISNPEELLRDYADASAILGACRWFDSKPNAGPGLLAKAIREGGMPDLAPSLEPACPGTPELRARWQAAMASIPLDTPPAVWLSHVHPHSHDAAGWTLGAEAWVIDWIGRYLPPLRAAAGCPVSVVACEVGP